MFKPAKVLIKKPQNHAYIHVFNFFFLHESISVARNILTYLDRFFKLLNKNTHTVEQKNLFITNTDIAKFLI